MSSAPKATRECWIGRLHVCLIDNGDVVFALPEKGTDAMLEQLFELPEDISRDVVILSMSPGDGADKFAAYELISRDPRIANIGKLRLVKGGAS